MKSGSVVGIDFGAAFGHATSSLPVPELIPFRLTQQFTSVLEPLDSTGHMRAHMCSALAALRASGAREVLLNAMDVFLNEVMCCCIATVYVESAALYAIAAVLLRQCFSYIAVLPEIALQSCAAATRCYTICSMLSCANVAHGRTV
jgi:Phosphatidylinositol 3- and 4-kinase